MVIVEHIQDFTKHNGVLLHVFESPKVVCK